MSTPLSGRTALVTGAAHPKGIGRAIANTLSAAGAHVWVLDLGPEDAFVDLAAGLTPLICEVTDATQVENTIAQIVATSDQLDIVVNNAGVARGEPDLLQVTEEDWAASINVNLLGVVNVCKASIPQLKKGSSIINVASLAGLGAIQGIPTCYSATKFAVVGLTKQLALELAPKGITCNALCPGSIETQMHAQTLQGISEEFGVDLDEAQEIENQGIPLGFTAQPQTVGDAAVFLASQSAAYITGVALPVAGGMAPGL